MKLSTMDHAVIWVTRLVNTASVAYNIHMFIKKPMLVTLIAIGAISVMQVYMEKRFITWRE